MKKQKFCCLWCTYVYGVFEILREYGVFEILSEYGVYGEILSVYGIWCIWNSKRIQCI